MKKQTTSKANPNANDGSNGANDGSYSGGNGDNGDFGQAGLPTGPTGRQIIVLRPDTARAGISAINEIAGIRATAASELSPAAADPSKGNIFFEELDIMVVEGGASQMGALEASVFDSSSPVLSVEPEMYVVPMDEPTPQTPVDSYLSSLGRDYILGYADAVQALATHLLATSDGTMSEEEAVEIAASYFDNANATWGLQATRVTSSRWSGAGMRVAVLDTGMDINHPDFVGRSIITRSFVPGQGVQDGHGHGTHCIGTSCGPKLPPGGGRRYGIAYNATILAGKVLSNQGSGTSGQVLAGINWAIANRATVISMSLGSAVTPGQAFSPAYEQAALAALNAGSLIVAAAGNAGNNPVGSPANCPSVMAVGAVDNNLQRASFSCLGINGNGGALDIAGPGVNVYSAAPMPRRYQAMSGTSMATPHVSGIAALWAERTGLRGRALWQKLTSTTRNIGQTPQQVGAGLVQAPVQLILPPIHRVPGGVIRR